MSTSLETGIVEDSRMHASRLSTYMHTEEASRRAVFRNATASTVNEARWRANYSNRASIAMEKHREWIVRQADKQADRPRLE
jgi:hypothetical protein